MSAGKNSIKPQEAPGYVYIIESPSANDLLDGRTEGELLQKALGLFGIRSEYRLAVDTACFKQAIKELKSLLRQSEANPILHISAHGSLDEGVQSSSADWSDCSGIALTNGEELSWEELRDLIQQINTITERKLIVCMSSCYGFGGILMGITSSHSQAFYALIGNMNSYLWSESGIAFATFYFQLFNKGVNLEQAVKKMRSASGNNGFKLMTATAAKAIWSELNKRKKASK